MTDYLIHLQNKFSVERNIKKINQYYYPLENLGLFTIMFVIVPRTRKRILILFLPNMKLGDTRTLSSGVF